MNAQVIETETATVIVIHKAQPVRYFTSTGEPRNDVVSIEAEGGVEDETKLVRTTISLPPDLLHAGHVRAKEQGRSFSNYVARLIEYDAKAAKEPFN